MSDADLSKVSSEALRAELARRQQAAKAKGKPMKHATKADWAEAKRVDFCESLATLRAEPVSGEHARRQRKDQEARRQRKDQEAYLEGEIRKFENLAKKYRREGV